MRLLVHIAFLFFSLFSACLCQGLSPVARQQFLDANGKPVVGGKLCTYVAGTSTPLATYSDSALSVANTNPLVLDSSGRPTSSGTAVAIYLKAASYKFILSASGAEDEVGVCPTTGAALWTQDNIGAGLFSSYYTASGVGAVARTLTSKLGDQASVEDYGATGDGVTDDTDAFVKAIASNSNISLKKGSVYLIGGTSSSNCLAWNSVNGVVIEGNGATIKIKDGTSLSWGFALYFYDVDGLHISNLTIDGNRDGLAYNVDGQSHGIFMQYVRNAVLENIVIKDTATDGIAIGPDPSDQTLRSENVQILNCKLYRSRRNNITLNGVRNVTILGGSNTYAGAAASPSTGTLPKAGIDLEPDTDGTAYGNDNVTIQGIEFSDNVANDITMALYASNIHIYKNKITNSGVGIQVTSSSHASNISISYNYISGGTYGITGSMSTGVVSNWQIDNNIIAEQSAHGIYFDGTTYSAGFKIAHNNISGSSYLLYFIGTVSDHYSNYVIEGNTYESTGDVLDADDNLIKYLSCHVLAEHIYRTGTRRYRVYLHSSSVNARNILLSGDHINVYDNTSSYDFPDAGSIDEITGSGIATWRMATEPISGTWAVGARVISSNPADAGPTGWVCVSAGSIGTWAKYGLIYTSTATIALTETSDAVTLNATTLQNNGSATLTPTDDDDGFTLTISGCADKQKLILRVTNPGAVEAITYGAGLTVFGSVSASGALSSGSNDKTYITLSCTGATTADVIDIARTTAP